ncbi:MAG: sel1 repeat family protein, partial [Flavobacterium sp.]|nr:sel1 repeat family protein [Flavobacterium sp.]
DRACYNMGTFYATGSNMPQDMEKAITWYDKASQLGNVRATETLGLMYRYGEGVPQDEAKADAYEKREDEQREAFLRQMDGM